MEKNSNQKNYQKSSDAQGNAKIQSYSEISFKKTDPQIKVEDSSKESFFKQKNARTASQLTGSPQDQINKKQKNNDDPNQFKEKNLSPPAEIDEDDNLSQVKKNSSTGNSIDNYRYEKDLIVINLIIDCLGIKKGDLKALTPNEIKSLKDECKEKINVRFDEKIRSFERTFKLLDEIDKNTKERILNWELF